MDVCDVAYARPYNLWLLLCRNGEHAYLVLLDRKFKYLRVLRVLGATKILSVTIIKEAKKKKKKKAGSEEDENKEQEKEARPEPPKFCCLWLQGKSHILLYHILVDAHVYFVSMDDQSRKRYQLVQSGAPKRSASKAEQWDLEFVYVGTPQPMIQVDGQIHVPLPFEGPESAKALYVTAKEPNEVVVAAVEAAGRKVYFWQ